MTQIRQRFCECGCGNLTRGGRFVPGHDAKMKSALLKLAAQGDQAALAELERRGWLNEDNRKFGVEIEFFGTTADQLITAMRGRGLDVDFMGYTHRTTPGWKIVTDCSVSGEGLELVSPILKGRAGFEQLRKACEALQAVGARVDTSCGLHVHHDAADISVRAAFVLTATYNRYQDTISTVLAPSRRGGNRYCGELSNYQLDTIRCARSISEFAGNYDRYHVINWAAYARHGSVEFRQHQGTTEFEKIANWVLFGQAMIRASKRQATLSALDLGSTLADMVGNLKLKAEQQAYFLQRAQTFARRTMAGVA